MIPTTSAAMSEPTNQEIRELAHNYTRMHQPEHYSDTEFGCLQDVIAFARALRALPTPAAAMSVAVPASACSIGVGNGSGNLLVHGDYDSIKAVQAFILDAEKWRAAAPVSADVRDEVLEQVAKIVDDKAENVAQWGAMDPDTGAFEFKNPNTEDAYNTFMELAEEIRAIKSQPAPVTQQAAPDGSWLWCRLMEWCKKRGAAPADYDDLFAIAGDAHRLNAAKPESVTLAELWEAAGGDPSVKPNKDMLLAAMRAPVESQPAAALLSDDEIMWMWIDRDCIDAIRAGDMRAQLVTFARAILAKAAPAAKEPT